MMPVATASKLDVAHPDIERVREHKDGIVLLSISQDRICRLNGVGALTWRVLEESPRSLTLDEIVEALQQKFVAINGEGEVHYEVSTEQLTTDTARFLNKMTAMKLLRVWREAYSIEEDVSGTTSARIAEVPPIKTMPCVEENLRPSSRETFSAFIGLLMFDLLLKFTGFHSVIKRVERWPTAQPPTTDLLTCRRVREAVDRAQMYYPKKAMCLQHSAVVTCLLRRRGVPAEMVLAAQEFPIRVHAWAEVEGHVVNDRQNVKTKHREMRRV